MRRPPPPARNIDFGAMTSMIDIVFLLLIFFVVTAATQVREWLLPTDLPEVGSVESIEMRPPRQEQAVTVDIWVKLLPSDDGSRTVVELNGTRHEALPEVLDQLRLLAELGPENPVILDVAEEVPLGDFVAVYDTAQAAGFESVSVAFDPEETAVQAVE